MLLGLELGTGFAKALLMEAYGAVFGEDAVTPSTRPTPAGLSRIL